MNYLVNYFQKKSKWYGYNSLLFFVVKKQHFDLVN